MLILINCQALKVHFANYYIIVIISSSKALCSGHVLFLTAALV